MDNSIPREALAMPAEDRRELAERTGGVARRGGDLPASPGSARGAAARASPGAGTTPTARRGGSAAGAGAPSPRVYSLT